MVQNIKRVFVSLALLNRKGLMATHGKTSSFTADVVAYRRTFTDIPFSKEIWEILQARLSPEEKKKQEMLNYPHITPLFEARYLLTDQILKKSGITQVLELAAGMSPRGMIKSTEGMTYVEFDYP